MPEAHVIPVLIGGGQAVDKPADPTLGKEPMALIEEAARRAADDAGGGARLLAAVDTLAVVNVVCHPYGDASAMLAERIGTTPARRIDTTLGGNTPQSLVNFLSDEIVAGRTEVALIAGAEAWHTMRERGKRGLPTNWAHRERTRPLWGDGRPGMSDLEARHGAARPIDTYPLYENAFRAARGLSIAAHHRELAEFGARCSAIAARNPYAWFTDAKSAAEIGTVTPQNRMVGFPYPKFMNAIIEVNQGAALLLASDGAARRLGIPPARWVYPWAGVDVTELWYVQDRRDYTSLPGLQRAFGLLLGAAGAGIEQIAHLDLYSCFPIAPRLSATMLGLAPDTERPLTLVGALPWFGGPGNNFTTHAIAAMVDCLRSEPASLGLVHALGWNMTKHAAAVYGGTPPPKGWRRAGGSDLQAWVDALPRPAIADAPSGPATIETYTVAHGRDGGPERAVVVGRLDDGRRFLAATPRDRALLEAMEREEQVGRRGSVTPGERTNVFTPS
jgi:acetyl-CoA C-acetyltransferase